MRHHDDEWLQQKIDEDIIAMADKRECELQAKPFYDTLDLSEEKQKELRAKLLKEMEHRDADWENILRDAPEELPIQETSADPAHTEHVVRRRFRWRPVFAAAAVLVLCLGLSMVGTGSKVYVPEIFQSERGNEETLLIDNSETFERIYDEEKVYVEIENQLGVIPIRFGFKPQGMFLSKYDIRLEEMEVLISYYCKERHILVYISKDYGDSSISNHVDGDKQDTIKIETNGIEVPVCEYISSDGEKYYEASFEYLNTYYSINAMIEKEDFKKLVENIIIKNV